MRIAFLVSTIMTFLLLGLQSSGEAFNLEQFIMPGPLSLDHAKFEKDCEKCHDSLDKTKHRENCLACHKEIAQDLSRAQGFHGKNEDVGQQECLHCHTEHQGRDADIILMDLDNFDHLDTDFLLKDAHLKVQCSLCHLADKKFRDAKRECFSCHKSNDPHKGALGEKCQDCHQEKGWKEYTFDHQKTKFQLKGVHEGLLCIRCHVNQKWKKLPGQCIACHQANDIHGNRFGDSCEKCHSTEKSSSVAAKKSNWSNTAYDHDKTKFKLVGKHIKVGCMQCHTAFDLGEGETSKQKKITCFSCHQKIDEHKTRYGKECEKCHTPEDWKKTNFNHEKTKFPLLDSHQKVSCTKCHTGSLYQQKLELTCVGCHRLDDKHAGSFGDKCESCHTVSKWQQYTFDHAKTKYNLVGKHLKVACAQCHYGIPAGAKIDTACNACHQKNDVHKGQQGQKCDKCHNVEGWMENIFFDHDLTNFPLIGLHGVASCEACHLANTFKDTSTICSDCHLDKDIHKNSFGVKCESCHTPNGWRIWAFDHDTQTKFLLTGAHIGLDCFACHKQSIAIKNSTPKKCEECHLRDDIHRGKYGKFCDRCHATDSFKNLLFGN